MKFTFSLLTVNESINWLPVQVPRKALTVEPRYNYTNSAVNLLRLYLFKIKPRFSIMAILLLQQFFCNPNMVFSFRIYISTSMKRQYENIEMRICKIE